MMQYYAKTENGAILPFSWSPFHKILALVTTAPELRLRVYSKSGLVFRAATYSGV